MSGTIRTCTAWADRHTRPIYTLAERCPDCGADTAPAAPARFSPEDPHGEYRRAFIRRHQD